MVPLVSRVSRVSEAMLCVLSGKCRCVDTDSDACAEIPDMESARRPPRPRAKGQVWNMMNL
jgi:hypothetical protein